MDEIDPRMLLDILSGEADSIFQTLQRGRGSDEMQDLIERYRDLLSRPSLKQDHKSFKSLKMMDKEIIHKQDEDATCAICLDNLCHAVEIPDDHVIKPELKADIDTFKTTVVKMPCKHRYHYFCLTLWLEKEHSCPTCRQKVKTDAEYEEEERQQNIEELHDSMYS